MENTKHMPILGRTFNFRHAAGVTEYRVVRPMRECGYWECVSVRGIEGTHHFVNGLQTFRNAEIEQGKFVSPRGEQP